MPAHPFWLDSFSPSVESGLFESALELGSQECTPALKHWLDWLNMNMALGPTGIKRIKQFVHIGHNGMLLKTLWRQLEILPRDVLLLGAQYPQRYEMLVFFGKFLHEIKIGPPKQFGCHFFHNCRCQKTSKNLWCCHVDPSILPLQPWLLSQQNLADSKPPKPSGMDHQHGCSWQHVPSQSPWTGWLSWSCPQKP